MRKMSTKKGFAKRATAITLAATMMLSMTACGEKKEEKKTKTDNNQYTTEANINWGTQSNNHVSVKEDTYDEGYACVEEYDAGCYATNDCYAEEYLEYPEYPDYNTNEYDDFAENSWATVAVSPLSTFAADVDTASYTEIRSNITNGYDVPASAVRIEEMINYFHYDYETPNSDEKFAVYTEYADCPWNEDTKLALVSLNTEAIDFSEAPASNIVFLIDTSGSMFDSNKLPLVQQSLTMLAENLTEKDRVSIVTYAGSDEVVLEGVSGDNYYEISSAIEGLEAYGSTNGSAGINTAYEIAEKYFIKGGNNRVILATDGDLNVGVTSEGELEKLITEKKDSGVFLSVIGVGYGNYKDNKLETLADKGNGNYSYIDSIFEAKKALVDEMGATLLTVAKDVKLQVEFNPENVKAYRLIGYENRVMAAEDFSDDTKDGGEMGAGHSVTAIYEIALADSDFEIKEPELKYGDEKSNRNSDKNVASKNTSDTQTVNRLGRSENEGFVLTDNRTVKAGDFTQELFTVNVRYKEPDEDVSKLNSYVCSKNNYIKNGSDNLRLAAAIAAFGMDLKDSQYKGSVDGELVRSLLDSVSDWSEDEYKLELMNLIELYYGFAVICY